MNSEYKIEIDGDGELAVIRISDGKKMADVVKNGDGYEINPTAPTYHRYKDEFEVLLSEHLQAQDKGEGEQEGPDALPWFEVPGRRSADTTVVYGHWSQRGLTLQPNLVGLDSGCVWGGKLSAVRLCDRSLLQVDCPQYQMPGA